MRSIRILHLIIFTTLLCLLLACGVSVPGGDFPPVTATPSQPTPTPVIISASQASLTPSPTFPKTATPVLSTATPTATPTPQANSDQGEEQPAEPEEPVGPDPTPESGSDDMVPVPAGSFTMGYDAGLDDEKPAHQADVADYQIDRFEVSNAQFSDFVKETDYQTEAERAGSNRSWRDEWQEGEDDHPVVRVSWGDAIAYCEWRGKRLPTEAEWEKAARGAEGYIYPWGDGYDPIRSNGKDSGVRSTMPAGSFETGASPYGAHDMAGNVREWTADEGYYPYPDNSAPSSYYGAEFRVLRGGGWFDTEADLRSTRRNATSPNAANWDIGFRCAR